MARRLKSPQASCPAVGAAFDSPFPDPIVAQRVPTVNDLGFDIGQVWVNPLTNQAWIMTGSAAGAATWSLASPGASDVDTINGLSPVAGNIIISGGLNLTDVNAGNTVTLNLDPAITLATSVTSPIYASAAAMAINPVGALTVTGGTTIDINAAANQGVTIQLGDAAGVQVLEIEDSASATVATIDSNGGATFVQMDGILGAVTPAAATATTITANTSVTSPLYTAAAADAVVQAGGVNDVVLRLGDAAGATFLRIQDSTTADVLTVDSNGVVGVLAGLTVAGAFAQTAGTFNVGQDNAGNAINIGAGNVARAMTIAAGAAAHTLAIGSAAAGAMSIDTAAGISLDAATLSNFTVTGAGADLNLSSAGGSVDLLASEAQVDAIDIQASNAAGGINMDCGTGGFDLLVTGGAFSIDGQAASNITVTSAGFDLSLQGVGCAVNVTSTQAENDAILIEASAANGGVLIRAGTGAIRMGDEADCTGITIGNVAPTATRNIVIGSGTVVTAAVTDTISIGGDGATTNANSIKAVNINTGGVAVGEVNTNIATGAVTSGTHLTQIATGNRAAGTMTLNAFTGSGTKIANLGNADALTTLNIDATTLINDSVNANVSICTGTSTGSTTIGNALAGAVTIDSVGVVELNSAGAAISIGTDANNFAVNVGTAGTRTVTVGSVAATSALVLQSGTGEITVTGTVKEIDAEFLNRSGDDIVFQASPICQSSADTGVAPTGANTNLNLIHFQEGMVLEQYIIGTQTIICPRMDATGLLSSLDLTATDGWELNFGATRANSRHSYTIGTSAAFYMELRFTVADVSGCEPLYFGFRKTQANQVDYRNYTDFVGYGLNNLIAGGDCVISTRLNSAGINTTDTNDAWADTGTHTLQVLVSAAGVVTFTFDGAPPTATQAYTFDNGDVVHPYITNLFGAAAPGTIHLQWLKVGFQP